MQRIIIQENPSKRHTNRPKKLLKGMQRNVASSIASHKLYGREVRSYFVDTIGTILQSELEF